MRNSVHHDFERDRHLLLDLLGRDARPLGDDFDVVISHVRVGFDRQLMERNSTPDKQQHREGDYQYPVVEREID